MKVQEALEVQDLKEEIRYCHILALPKTLRYKISILFAQFFKIELESIASNSFNIFFKRFCLFVTEREHKRGRGRGRGRSRLPAEQGAQREALNPGTLES